MGKGAASQMQPTQGCVGGQYPYVISRSNEEKFQNPDRLVLDRRKLTACPFLEGEERLRLLNYQNNFIQQIENLSNLPNLIFLDLYNNQVKTMENLDQVCNVHAICAFNWSGSLCPKSLQQPGGTQPISRAQRNG